MIFLAVDPGLTGAVAEYNTVTDHLVVHDMPVTEREFSGKKRKVMDEEATVRLISGASLWATHFIIERVGGMPGQSGPGAFTFGYGCGVLMTAARCNGFIIERVEPSRWKAALRVPADKNRARERASELMPKWSHLWPLKKHDGRAEAALLALYGAKVFG